MDITKTGPRGFYWDPVRIPYGSYDANPLSPHAKEALRTSIGRKDKFNAFKSSGSVPIFMNSSASIGTTLGRRPPTDKTQLLVDTGAQDLNAEVGIRRSLDTNIVDLGSHVNVNMLRFEREQGFTSKLHKDAGPVYSPSACTGNWVEERHEQSYSSGFHPRELGFTKLYQTEHSARFTPPTKKYYNKVLSEQPIAKFPAVPRATTDVEGLGKDGRYIYYSKEGFGEAPRMDHTKPSSIGGYWVGTSPVKKKETITRTAHLGDSLEFQRRNICFDPKAGILAGTKQLDMSDALTARTVKGLNESQRYADSWKTIYKGDYLDRSRRTLTP
ncbi:hypothetical protein CEUSTIGMA_g1425.t1 [Chlamydomonas eustigma]|uniref:Uncharacterized protein n=1 Tax=Chlamydomonas eustigma TaxID=1157962 RepID=A0A250WT30_9CHLO|nr:hypothetical protein CEUSTIGMA_g1425.t1 [Chlamydomonas eustigma]|eukprot:GAX73975.1 hypothetical protein CEUSTIGMA_g1425.t1 [Chlamydomonas eustigma]